MSVDRSIARRALLDSVPLFIPAIPFALVLGLAIDESGIGALLGWSTSPIIFGGAAQLTMVSLIGGGVGVWAAAVAALVVNARHLMYSAALAPTFQRQPTWFRWFGPYLLIDQLFALSTFRMDEEPGRFRTYYLAAGMTFWVTWIATTALGLLVGPIVPESWHLEFAVPILFVGLLVIGIDDRPKVVAAVVGALVTWLAAGLPNRGGLLVGSLAGILAGTLATRARR